MTELETVARIFSKGYVKLDVYGDSCYSKGIGVVGAIKEIEQIGRWRIGLTNGYTIWADKIQKGD